MAGPERATFFLFSVIAVRLRAWIRGDGPRWPGHSFQRDVPRDMPGKGRPALIPLRLLAGAMLASTATQAMAWGEDGHSIVAEIAQRRLSPEATATVSRLLGHGVSLASVGSWADDVRSDRPQTYNWHFVDIPLDRNDYDEHRDCASTEGGDCVVRELQRLKTELRCAGTDDARRVALRFTVHFVGDIHQPLHTVADQRGGNEVKVRGVMHGNTCRGHCDIGEEASNLHALWDTGLIRRTVWDWGAYVDRLENGLLRSDDFARRAAGGTPADWAVQTHAVAQQVWNDRLVPPDGTLDDRYYAAVLPLLDRQLALAGVRLAGFLNEAYASSQCEVTKAAG